MDAPALTLQFRFGDFHIQHLPLSGKYMAKMGSFTYFTIFRISKNAEIGRRPHFSLKHEFQRPLDDAWVLRCGDLAEILIVARGDRRPCAEAVRQIERFAASLEFDILADIEGARQCRIDFPETGPRNRGTSGIAERALIRNSKSIRIDPARWIWMVAQRISRKPLRSLRVRTA